MMGERECLCVIVGEGGVVWVFFGVSLRGCAIDARLRSLWGRSRLRAHSTRSVHTPIRRGKLIIPFATLIPLLVSPFLLSFTLAFFF